ncbi:hypothetical protein FHG64_18495 [Antarcticibacterium flavum]|uniref:Uncharacterized protein n=1 Tax=Antarcticibacterium flavum TaxID=2058175 RepID=A0A5B7X742_9FLAO|nr:MULTISPECIES: hypothetical protein [Antarcticibacterium]MCM4160628.1 hypothetical protein [Antarcticibacterium sp. W02-3]QCY71219.1 hypothetical protein FHG64_18495 [Antarcticibacterium flavum]
MAEIKIEKKKPIWPWILVGLIILGIILYFLFAGNDDDMDDMDDNRTEQVSDTTYTDAQRRDNDNSTMGWDETSRDTLNDDSVSNYLSHVGDRERMGVDHEYTNNALIHLIDAVEAKAAEVNMDIDKDLEEMRDEAEAITQNPQATNHADKIKETGNKIVDVLERMQEENFPNLSGDVEDVRTALQDIDSSTLTLEQKEEINSFFREAADVLRSMSNL